VLASLGAVCRLRTPVGCEGGADGDRGAVRRDGRVDDPLMADFLISVTVLPAGDGMCSVVRLTGEADLTTTSLRDTLTDAVARKPRLILVDMSALRFIDSGAMQMIVAAYRVFRGDGGTLALVHPTPAVARVLELTGVSELVTVYDSVDAAITSACEAPKRNPGH
jgi:anti-anti-sigma factor